MRCIFTVFSLFFCSFFAGAADNDSDSIRVLIVDGRNNHAWEGTTTAIRQGLLQTGAFSVDVSTAPLKYNKPP